MASRARAGALKARQEQFGSVTNSGGVIPAPAPAPEHAQQEEQEQPEAVEESKAPEQEPDPTETTYERARRAFLRNGWKDDEFRKLERREAIRRGVKLERQQNRQAAEYAALKSKAEKGEGSPDSTNGGTLSGVPTPSVQSRLADLYAKHGVNEDPTVKAEFDALLSPILAENAQLKRDQGGRGRAQDPDANQRRVANIRAELQKSIPELGDDDDFVNEVGPTMVVLGHLPKYASADTDDSVLRDLMVTATRLALEEVAERDRAVSTQGAASSGSMGAASVRSFRAAKPQGQPGSVDELRDRVRARFMELRRGNTLASLRNG